MLARQQLTASFSSSLGTIWMLINNLLFIECPSPMLIFANFRFGLNAQQAEFVVWKYCSHRKVGTKIMMDLNMLNNPA